MFKLGCFGIILSIFLIAGGAFLLISEEVGGPIIEDLFCPENDTFVRTSRPAQDGGENINFYCRDDDGGALNNIDGQVLLLIFAPLGVLALSIVFTAIGGSRRATKAQQTFLQNYTLPTGNNIQAKSYSYTANINDPELKAILGPLITQAQQVQPNQQLTLKEKLLQLRDAHDEGLIDSVEYERRKEAILDELIED